MAFYGYRKQGHQGYPLDNTRLLDFLKLEIPLTTLARVGLVNVCCTSIEQRRLLRPAVESKRIRVSRHHFLHHMHTFVSLFT